MINPESLEAIYRQVPANYYEKGRKNNLFQRFWHDRKRVNLDRLSEKEPTNILDVGCSSGHILAQIGLKFPKAKLVGVDISPYFINFAKKKYPNINFILTDAHKLHFKANAFDLVICTETLEHVVDPKKVLGEIKKVLKPSGYALVSMDTGSGLFKLIWFFWTKIGPGRVWRGSHISEFNKRKLKRLLIGSGFKIVEEKEDMLGMAVYFRVKK